MQTLAYRKVADVTDGVPWIVETAFAGCPNAESRRLITGVNWSPGIVNSESNILRYFRDTSRRTGDNSFAERSPSSTRRPLLDEHDQLAVIRGLRDGSRAAWTALYDRYCADVWRYVGRLMGTQPADIADVVQETFLAAARSARQFDASRGTLWSWLAGIAHHQAAAHWRRSERTARLRALAEAGAVELRHWLDGDESPHDVCERRETGDLVRAVLSQLPADYAALLSAKYLDDQSLDDLARRFGSSVEAIKSKLARARREFRAKFESLSRESTPSVRE